MKFLFKSPADNLRTQTHKSGNVVCGSYVVITKDNAIRINQIGLWTAIYSSYQRR